MSKIFDEEKVSALILRWQSGEASVLPEIVYQSQKMMDMLIARIPGITEQDKEDWQSELKLKLIKLLPSYNGKSKAFSFIFRSLLNHILSQSSRNDRRIQLSSIEQEDFDLAENRLINLERMFDHYEWN